MSGGYSVLFLPLCPHREGHQELGRREVEGMEMRQL